MFRKPSAIAHWIALTGREVNTTVRSARAFRDGWTSSEVKVADYVLAPNPIDDPHNFVRQQYLDFSVVNLTRVV